MTKSIAIIGAGGQMGKWLAGYFVKKGFEVTGFDTENPIPFNIKKAESLISAILNKEYVLLSTPTKKTPEIIRLIAKEM
ncbi:MAG: prephenate dehydrogenase/arogenate dehydrogenase family protein, partial [Thermoproteota archaeon]|nr:prephenate dehydrogenase/arogenate dehydrogenase family protein [Thermoproteota archaeon]